MGPVLYFAYGSNMLTARLARRCPSVQVIGQACAEGYDVMFANRSVDASGKAMLTRADARQRHFGVLFEIDSADLAGLDLAEGPGYERVDRFPVVHAGGLRPDCAVTYRARDVDSSLRPYDWYLALVIQGAIEHGLPAAQIGRLQATAFIRDPEPGRRGRQEALEVLRAAGCREPFLSLADCS
jgi:gamma-glutamylcyclotransferase